MSSKRNRLDKRTLGILAIVLGAQSIICAGLVMSVHNKKAALEQTLAGKATALNNVRTVSAGLPGLQAQYEKMQAQVRFLEKGLPQPAYIPTLLGDIEKTATASGVTIQEFRPKVVQANAAAAGTADAKTAEESTGGFEEKQFDLTVSGSYGQIQKFLHSLTRFRKILALDSIKLQPESGSVAKKSPSLTGVMTLTAFVLPPLPDALPEPTNSVAAAGAPAPVAKTTPAAKVAKGQGLTAQKAAVRG